MNAQPNKEGLFSRRGINADSDCGVSALALLAVIGEKEVERVSLSCSVCGMKDSSLEAIKHYVRLCWAQNRFIIRLIRLGGLKQCLSQRRVWGRRLSHRNVPTVMCLK